jgi:hypothetical protein
MVAMDALIADLAGTHDATAPTYVFGGVHFVPLTRSPPKGEQVPGTSDEDGDAVESQAPCLTRFELDEDASASEGDRVALAAEDEDELEPEEEDELLASVDDVLPVFGGFSTSLMDALRDNLRLQEEEDSRLAAKNAARAKREEEEWAMEKRLREADERRLQEEEERDLAEAEAQEADEARRRRAMAEVKEGGMEEGEDLSPKSTITALEAAAAEAEAEAAEAEAEAAAAAAAAAAAEAEAEAESEADAAALAQAEAAEAAIRAEEVQLQDEDLKASSTHALRARSNAARVEAQRAQIAALVDAERGATTLGMALQEAILAVGARRTHRAEDEPKSDGELKDEMVELMRRKKEYLGQAKLKGAELAVVRKEMQAADALWLEEARLEEGRHRLVAEALKRLHQRPDQSFTFTDQSSAVDATPEMDPRLARLLGLRDGSGAPRGRVTDELDPVPVLPPPAPASQRPLSQQSAAAMVRRKESANLGSTRMMESDPVPIMPPPRPIRTPKNAAPLTPKKGASPPPKLTSSKEAGKKAASLFSGSGLASIFEAAAPSAAPTKLLTSPRLAKAATARTALVSGAVSSAVSSAVSGGESSDEAGVVAGGHVKPALKLKTSSAKLAYDKQYNLKEAGWERPSHIKWDPSTKQVLRRAKQAAKENRGGTIDLTPQGNTHRVVYGKASDAVINRVAPSRPVLDLEDGEIPLQGREWLAKQIELTAALNQGYASKNPVQDESNVTDTPAGSYVPKARKTVRANQKGKVSARQLRPTGLGVEGHVKIATGRRMKTGRRCTRVDM